MPPHCDSMDGPVVVAARRALETGDVGVILPSVAADGEAEVLCATVRDEVDRRHGHAMALKAHAGEGIAKAREYVQAMLDLQVWAHRVYRQATVDPHATGTHD